MSPTIRGRPNAGTINIKKSRDSVSLLFAFILLFVFQRHDSKRFAQGNKDF